MSFRILTHLNGDVIDEKAYTLTQLVQCAHQEWLNKTLDANPEAAWSVKCNTHK